MAKRLRNRDTFHFIIELLESRSSHIRHYQCNDVADDCCKEAPEDIVGSKIDDGSDKGEMPVVPKVDVDGAGCASWKEVLDGIPGILGLGIKMGAEWN